MSYGRAVAFTRARTSVRPRHVHPFVACGRFEPNATGNPKSLFHCFGIAVRRIFIFTVLLAMSTEASQGQVSVSTTKAHTSPAANNHFRQGQQTGANFTFSITNNGPGSTTDPDGTHPLTVVDVLAAGLTAGTLPTGTPWACTSVSQTVICKSDNAIVAGSSYPLLTIPVKVATNASSPVNNQASLSGAGITPSNSNIDTVTIDPAPILAISKAHSGSFVQGAAATWTLQVTNNSGLASGATDGSAVTVTDTLPQGYTLQNFSGTNWNCTGSNTITCTSSAVVAGADANFPLITLTVNVAGNSPTSVQNSAKAFGGGDVTHTTAGTAAVSNTDMVTVKSASAATLTTACPTTFLAGQSFPMTAKVTGNNPTGSSSFLDDGIAIAGCASVALSGGGAACATSSLTTGLRDLTVAYGGDGNNGASNSAPLFVTVLAVADAIFLDGFEQAAGGCPTT
jgi:uncharacterized repeat protein (TIGR01451 family)